MSAKDSEIQIITANTTASGAVTYLGSDGGWSAEIGRAAQFEPGPELDEALRSAAAREAEVCDPYAMTVVVDADRVQPVRIREKIRNAGPTVAVRRGDAAPVSHPAED